MCNGYSSEEKDIIKEFYPNDGAKAVRDEMARRGLPLRSADSIRGVAAKMGVRSENYRGRIIHSTPTIDKVKADVEVACNVELAHLGPEHLPPEMGITRQARQMGGYSNGPGIKRCRVNRNGRKPVGDM